MDKYSFALALHTQQQQHHHHREWEMKNLGDVIDIYDRIIPVISNKYLDELLINRRYIDNVFRMLSDDESKYLYGQELLLCIFKNFLNVDRASTFSGLMSNKYFNSCCEEVISKNVCPEMVYSDGPNASKY